MAAAARPAHTFADGRPLIGSNHIHHNSMLLAEDKARIAQADKPSLYDGFFNPAAARADLAEGRRAHRLAQAQGASTSLETLARADSRVVGVDASYVQDALQYSGGRGAYVEVNLLKNIGLPQLRPLPASVRRIIAAECDAMYFSAEALEFGEFIGKNSTLLTRIGGSGVHGTQ